MRKTDLATLFPKRRLIVNGRKIVLSVATVHSINSGLGLTRQLSRPLLVILLLISVNGWIFPQANEDNWYSRTLSLKLAVTTKQQLESRFSGAKITKTNEFDWGIAVYYHSKTGWFHASYARGGCNPDNPNGYDLPDDTLFSFSYFAFKGVKLSKLRDLQLSHLDSFSETDTPNEVYTDYEAGRAYTVYRQRELTSVGLFATESLMKDIRCPRGNVLRKSV